MSNVLSIKDLHVKINQSHILHGVSFDIPSHKVTALLGRNGVGKSTTLKTIMGFYSGTGSIQFNGKEIINSDTFRIAQSGIAYIPEDREIFSSLSVRENLALAARGKDHGDAYKFVHSLFPELDTRAGQRAGSLSGGQQQRLCIARSLAVKPKVLLMDEPCSALDPGSTLRIEETIAQLSSSMTIIIVTHNMQQAARVSDYTAFFLSDGGPGQLVEVGPTNEIFSRPKDQRTENYVSGRFG